MLKDIKKQENGPLKRNESVQKEKNNNLSHINLKQNNNERSQSAIPGEIVAGHNFVFKYSGALQKLAKATRIAQAKSFQIKERDKLTQIKASEEFITKAKKRAEELDGGKAYRSGRSTRKFSRRYLEVNQTINNPPAIIKDYFKDDDSGLTERQKLWKKNVLTNEDLKQKTAPKYKVKNRLRLWQYILYNHYRACRSTILYYLIPLILNMILLIENFKTISFVENIIVSAVAFGIFALILFIFKTFKTVERIIVLSILAFILYNAIIIFTMYNPEIVDKIYSPFIIKAFLIYIGIYYFSKVFVIFFITYGQDVDADFGNVVKVKSGAPGVGKTSQGVHEAHIMALLKWQQLQYDFFIWHSREKEILKRNNKEELLKYHEIKTSYYFYANRPGCTPCLWSNIEITDLSGRKNHVVELGHIHGVDRLPLYSVVFFDEIGAVLKNEFSLKKGEFYDVSDMFRLGRQFVNWSVICCEQDPSNIYIDCRRVVGVNEYISGQISVCKPILMTWLMNILHFFVKIPLDKKVKRKPLTAKILTVLDKFYASLGFRRQVYSTGSNLLTGVKTDKKSEDNNKINYSGKQRSRYLPANTGVKYNQDEYKKLYACYFDKEIKGKLAGEEELINYIIGKGRDLVSETSLLNEKREIIDKQIKKLS